jgi:hypothetical protein
MRKKTCQCHKKRPPVETTEDFRMRLATMLRKPGDNSPYKKVQRTLRRPKGSQPTPAEVLGGAKMQEVEKPPRAIAKWLRSLGVKV